MKKSLFCLMLVILVGCSQEASEGKPEQKPLPLVEVENVTTTFTHPDTQQDFSIIRTDKFLQNYIDKVQSNPEKFDNYQTYTELFAAPMKELCVADDSSKADPYNEVLFQEKPHAGRLSQLESLRGKMDDEDVTAKVKEALTHSASLLPSEDMTSVCVFPITEASGIDFLGSAGMNGIISIYVSESMDETTLMTTVAHEYNHSVLFKQFADVAYGNTLLDYMVFEGKAEYFEEIAYPEHTGKEVYEYDESLWREAEESLYEEVGFAEEEIMYGSDKFPYAYGYNEGYKILSEYLERHPDMEIEDWMAASAEEIYEGSQYASYYD